MPRAVQGEGCDPSPAPQLTCIGFQVLRSDHDHEPDGPLVPEHLVGPAPDGPHALHCCNAIICYQDLGALEAGMK